MICVYALTTAGRDATRFVNVGRDAPFDKAQGVPSESRGTKRPADASGAKGMAGERLRWITAGRVAAIAGELPRRPTPTLARARRYDQIVRALAHDARPILPARFGTCFRSVEELESALRARERALLRALAVVRGRVQMVVRVPTTEVADHEHERPLQRAGVTGADYLRAKAATAARARYVAGFEPVREAARRWIRNEVVEKRGRVASVYHLIPRASATAYVTAVRRTAVEAGLRVVVSGPMPAYAFADPLRMPSGR
jgi:hypothetical protein